MGEAIQSTDAESVRVPGAAELNPKLSTRKTDNRKKPRINRQTDRQTQSKDELIKSAKAVGWGSTGKRKEEEEEEEEEEEKENQE